MSNVRHGTTVNRTTWHDYAEWGCKIATAFLASFAGVALMERFRLGDFGQTLFWPIYATLIYWVVIRDIHFKRPKVAEIPKASVLVRLALEDSQFGTTAERQRIHRFTDKLAEALSASGVGDYDGDEFGEGECVLFMYGPDADAMYRTIDPILRKASFLRGAKVELFGPGAQVPLRTEVL